MFLLQLNFSNPGPESRLAVCQLDTYDLIGETAAMRENLATVTQKQSTLEENLGGVMQKMADVEANLQSCKSKWAG